MRQYVIRNTDADQAPAGVRYLNASADWTFRQDEAKRFEGARDLLEFVANCVLPTTFQVPGLIAVVRLTPPPLERDDESVVFAL